jgi:hypothetical protein
MIMPDPVKALTHVSSLLKPNGTIYVTQTFEKKKNFILEVLKPLLKYILTIDFGQVTYEADVRTVCCLSDVVSSWLQ